MNPSGGLYRAGTRDPIGCNRVLVVEGRDLGGFCFALLRQLGLEKAIEIRNGGGLPDFYDYFQDLPQISGFPGVVALGAIQDCEQDPAGAFRALCAGLARAGLPVPAAPLQATQAPPLPQVSVMLLPDSQTPGMLETLC